jgi:hypothetical protein
MQSTFEKLTAPVKKELKHWFIFKAAIDSYLGKLLKELYDSDFILECTTYDERYVCLDTPGEILVKLCLTPTDMESFISLVKDKYISSHTFACLQMDDIVLLEIMQCNKVME